MNTAGVVECDDVQLLDLETLEIDFIEEIRLRTWARKNYVATCERSQGWHPVILHEMERMDLET